jgi:hypothetical protein
VEVGVEEAIVNAPTDYNSDQLFKSNFIFCVFLICNLKNQYFYGELLISYLNFISLFALFVLICNLEKSVFLR